ncbi:MAG: hypothetical protein HFE86_01030 [Clostridiales bacterium]|nr:hypothetical protein [Clostridiales bacterium]
MPESLICLMFDRSGGALARFGTDYWHGYDDMERLAADFCRYAQTGETNFLPRNEKRDYEWPSPDGSLIARGQVAWYSYDEIKEALREGTFCRIGDAGVFFDALRRHLPPSEKIKEQ